MAVWLVRAGKHGEREALALEKDLVVIGWEELPDLSKIKTREEMQALLEKTYPDAKPNKIINHTGQLWAFVQKVKDGDLLVLPLKNRAGIAVGRAQGAYQFRADLPGDAHHARAVKWIKKDLPRTSFDQDLLYSLGAFLTVCQIQRNNAEQRIRALVEGKPTKPTSPETVAPTFEATEAEAPSDLDEVARGQIIQLIDRKFKGHNLTRLVEAILRAQGYQTIMSGAGADESVDILAGLGRLGFDHPRLGVEVKSQNSPVGTDVIDKLRGGLTTFGATEGLVVSWGGFKSSVDRRKGYFHVRLWDQDDLLNALFENYEKLPKEIQAEIPLERIWILLPEE